MPWPISPAPSTAIFLTFCTMWTYDRLDALTVGRPLEENHRKIPGETLLSQSADDWRTSRQKDEAPLISLLDGEAHHMSYQGGGPFDSSSDKTNLFPELLSFPPQPVDH